LRSRTILYAFRQQSVVTSMPVELLLEAWTGIDEFSLKPHVDKMNGTRRFDSLDSFYVAVLINTSLTPWKQIEKMPMKKLASILEIARVPEELRSVSDCDILRVTVRNTMLAVIEKMSLRELLAHLNRVQWVTYDHSRESMKEALRLWLMHPDTQLFSRRRFEGTLLGRHLTERFLTNMPFMLNHEIKAMTEAQVSDALTVRGQSTVGNHLAKIERLMCVLMPLESLLITQRLSRIYHFAHLA
jgi:hypothetical protein